MGRVGATVGTLGRAVLDPRILVGVAQELVWVGAHTASYPLGLLKERPTSAPSPHRLSHLPPRVRGLHHEAVGTADVPVVLVHGLVDNRTIFAVFRRVLARRGFQRVSCHSFSLFTRDIATAAADLGRTVARICEETGHDEVVIVGHSLGGLLARWYVQKLGGDARVRTVVTLGTPHAGSQAARMWPTSLARQLLPGSDVLRALDEPAPGCRTRFVAIWSDLDELIAPRVSARLSHPDLQHTNVLVRGVGHMALLISGRVQQHVVRALAGLDLAEDSGTEDAPAAEGLPTRLPAPRLPAETEQVIDLRDDVRAPVRAAHG